MLWPMRRFACSSLSLPVAVPMSCSGSPRAHSRLPGLALALVFICGGQRLLPGSCLAQVPNTTESPVDIVPFGRVVTWDPNRNDGCRANRVQEYRAEDVFLETELARDRDGGWQLPSSSDRPACIGVQWLNSRAVRELRIAFARPLLADPTTVRVEGWFGESAWQGVWKPLEGSLQQEASGLVFQVREQADPVKTRKIRWILPSKASLTVRSMLVFTHSKWATTALRVETDRSARNTRGTIAIINGAFADSASPPGASRTGAPQERQWNGSRPARLRVRYSQPDSFKSDPTVLQLRLPSGAFGVAVEDVIRQGCVYLPEYGVYVCREPGGLSLAEYKHSILQKKTILGEVRQLPDQTLEQAMAKTHHLAQREGPVMLSLACDNAKFVLERDGRLKFPASTNGTADWWPTVCEFAPQFGEGPGELTRRLEDGWLPTPVLSAARAGLLYELRAFVAPADEPGNDPARLNRVPVCVVEVTVTNRGEAAASAVVSLRAAQNRKPVRLPAGGPGTAFAFGEGGWRGMLRTPPQNPLKLEERDGGLVLGGECPPHSSSRLAFYLADGRADLNAFADADASAHRLAKPEGPNRAAGGAAAYERLEAYWRAVLASAIQVETPEPLLNNVMRSSQVRCLIAARNESNGARVAPWIAAMSYGPLESEANSVIRGMDLVGHHEFARRGLEYFVHRYNTNGFLTTGYTTFGTAWHLWTLGQHYRLTRDRQWAESVAPELKRVGDWIVRQTEKTRRPGAPEFGLMPPGVMADWNAFAYHFALNAYYYAALSELAALLEDLNDAQAKFFRRAAADLRENIRRAYHWTAAQSPALPLRNGTWIPAYPSQVHSPGKLADFFPGQDAGRSWCYDVELGAHQLVPAGVLEPASPEATQMLEHMEDVQFLADGWFDYPAAMNNQDWFDLGGFSKVQPYYTRNGEVCALRDEVKPFIRSYFNTLAAMLNPEVLTIWEHFNHSGAWDKTHETGYFLYQTRTMLVTERGNELWLVPFVSTNWLTAGKTLSVSNAPTRFGQVSFRIDSQLRERRILARVFPPARPAPAAIVLRLRHPQHQPIRSVRLNGRRHTDFSKAGETIRLKPGQEPLEVEVFY